MGEEVYDHPLPLDVRLQLHSKFFLKHQGLIQEIGLELELLMQRSSGSGGVFNIGSLEITSGALTEGPVLVW